MVFELEIFFRFNPIASKALMSIEQGMVADNGGQEWKEVGPSQLLRVGLHDRGTFSFNLMLNIS